MAHVGNSMLCHFRLGCRHNVISPIHWEEPLGSCGNDQPNASQQQQRTTRFVEHGVEGLVFVFGPAQQEATTCSTVYFVAVIKIRKLSQSCTSEEAFILGRIIRDKQRCEMLCSMLHIEWCWIRCSKARHAISMSEDQINYLEPAASWTGLTQSRMPQ